MGLILFEEVAVNILLQRDVGVLGSYVNGEVGVQILII
jgi:hypothetical protein